MRYLCKKNASLREAFARIIIESEDISLMFPGQIKNGIRYNPPIFHIFIFNMFKLKPLLTEGASTAYKEKNGRPKSC